MLKEAKRKEALDEGDVRTTHQIEAQRQAAARLGATYQLVVDETLRKQTVRYWNCLALLGWFNRGRGISSYAEEKALQSFLGTECARERAASTVGAVKRALGLSYFA